MSEPTISPKKSFRCTLYIATLLALALISGIAAVANAQTTTSTTTRTASTTNPFSIATTSIGSSSLPAPLQAPTSSVSEPDTPPSSTELDNTTQQRVMNLAANISNSYDAVVFRFENILDRIDTRTNKIANDGKDVTLANERNQEARTTLATATESLRTIDETVFTATSAANPALAWLTTAEQYRTIEQTLKTARIQIASTLTALRTAPDKVEPTATAPVATTSTTTAI